MHFLFAACVDGVACQRILPRRRVLIGTALKLLAEPVVLVMRSRYFVGNIDRKLRFAEVRYDRGAADALGNLRVDICALLICSLGNASLHG